MPLPEKILDFARCKSFILMNIPGERGLQLQSDSADEYCGLVVVRTKITLHASRLHLAQDEQCPSSTNTIDPSCS
jgi:hypothetical protein